MFFVEGNSSKILSKQYFVAGKHSWTEEMAITLAPRGRITDDHMSILEKFLDTYSWLNLDGSKAFGMCKIPTIICAMSSEEHALQALLQHERDVVLQYHFQCQASPPAVFDGTCSTLSSFQSGFFIIIISFAKLYLFISSKTIHCVYSINAAGI